MINDGLAEMLEQAGAKNIKTYDAGSFPGMGIHEMGTARMGRDPKTSVLNAAQSGVGREQRLRHGRFVHGLERLSKPLAHIHGDHRSRGGPRGE